MKSISVYFRLLCMYLHVRTTRNLKFKSVKRPLIIIVAQKLSFCLTVYILASVYFVVHASPHPPELVEYSMAQLANPGEENQDALLYQIHDLFLDYLKHLITEDQQVGTLYNILTIRRSIQWVYDVRQIICMKTGFCTS